MKSPKTLVAMLLTAATSLFAAQDATRQRLLMDFGWRFSMGDAPDADIPRLSHLEWQVSYQAVRVPFEIHHIGANP